MRLEFEEKKHAYKEIEGSSNEKLNEFRENEVFTDEFWDSVLDSLSF